MTHASDCAVHNEPAMPAAPCDCAPTFTKYRRKPTPPIDAVQFTDPNNPPAGVTAWGDGTFHVITLQGTRTPVSVGEWIVKEQSNPERHYPIADGEFQRLYEPHEEPKFEHVEVSLP